MGKNKMTCSTLRMYVLVVSALFATAFASQDAFYEEYAPYKVKSVRCYQCAYTPDRMEVEEIKTPKIIRKEVTVPKIVEDVVEVPRIVWEEVSRPRVIEEQHTYYDEKTGEWKVGNKPRTVHDVIWISREVREKKKITKQIQDIEFQTKQIFDVRQVTKKRAGGWDKCLGPFSEQQALEWGVDQWECNSKCYIKTDANGNALRGCYKDEFGVDPSKPGCQTSHGTTYCFCDGSLCNNGKIPDFKAV